MLDVIKLPFWNEWCFFFLYQKVISLSPHSSYLNGIAREGRHYTYPPNEGTPLS